ncbi:aminopeptidase N [Penaeus vannamei]|uniref:aminopeptidase N n=1 Tax=Penaeus vannamei TaxID=6689 RepID=UPI00387F72AB
MTFFFFTGIRILGSSDMGILSVQVVLRRVGMKMIAPLLLFCHVISGLPGEYDIATPSWTSTDEQPSLVHTEASSVSLNERETSNLRLPRSLKPLHYSLRLQPFINGNFSILGHVEVEMEVLEPTSNITLHMADIITKNDTAKLLALEEEANREVMIRSQQYDPARQFYVVHLGEFLQKGRTYLLSVEYRAYLSNQLRGFYRSTYTDVDGSKRNLATTHFQPTDARRAFPCFDEPALKATFEVHLARETWMTSLSNMPLAETRPVEGQEGWVWDRFERSVPMSTYLVAFVVSDFVFVKSTEHDRVLFRVWARRQAIDAAHSAREVGPKVMRFFEEFLGTSYPLAKQDMIAVPDFSAGAMENWGLMTYRESILLDDPNTSTLGEKAVMVQTISHELAHNWFGNLVTAAWWNDIWLNEGFATYMAFLGTDFAEPTWKVMETTVIENLQKVFQLDSLQSSHRMSIPVSHSDEIDEIFDMITYTKGAMIIRMMEHYLGKATFQKGLSSYLNSLKYENATQNDLWEHLTVAASEDGTLPEGVIVKDIMDAWTLQAGYPVVHVMRTSDGSSATVTKKRFLIEDINGDYGWWVPLTCTTQSEANFNQTRAVVWMKDSEAQIRLSSLPPKDQWVIFNLQQTGYYRVNYDDHNWGLLIQQLKDDHKAIHPINRAQIIDDAMNLARAGQLSYGIALGVFAYLRNETEYLPWTAAVRNLNFMLKASKEFDALKDFMSDLVLPLYEAFAFDDGDGDSPLEKKNREIVRKWACGLGNKDCMDKALTLFRQWMLNPDNFSTIPPSVLCNGIRKGDEAAWNFTWIQYLKTDVASQKPIFLRALACTTDTLIRSRFLHMVVDEDGDIRQHDVWKVLSAIGGSLTWNYLTLHWNDMFTYKKSYRGEVMKAIISDVAPEQVEQFLSNKTTDMSGNHLAIQQVRETIRNNKAWKESYYEVVARWLKDNGYSS